MDELYCYKVSEFTHWPYRLSARTPAFHAGKRSSTLRRVTGMEFKECNEDDVKLSKLESGFIEENVFTEIHKNTTIVCHDILIRYHSENASGILLLKRNGEPAHNVYYPAGGRLLRGVPIEESMRRKIKEETGLSASNFTFLTVGRTLFSSDPFSHKKGTDTVNLVYIADGIGTLMPNSSVSHPIFITKDTYGAMRKNLSAYNQYILDIVDTRNLW